MGRHTQFFDVCNVRLTFLLSLMNALSALSNNRYSLFMILELFVTEWIAACFCARLVRHMAVVFPLHGSCLPLTILWLYYQSVIWHGHWAFTNTYYWP